MRNLKIIYLWLIAVCLSISNTAFADITEKWQEVPSTFELKKSTKENAVVPHTIAARLIQLSGKNIEDVIDADGKTIEYFSVSYRIPINLTGDKSRKTKLVTQYGLYRTIDTDLRAALSRHHSPLRMTIRYDVENPTSFKFVIDNTVYTTPILVMDN